MAKQMRTCFEPVDKKEHEAGNAGKDVPDYCRNCYRTFMDHTNGVCPPDAECGVGTGCATKPGGK